MAEAMLEALMQTMADPMVWLIVFAAALYGIFIGSVPGLTATTGVALFVPLTYWMDPLPAIAAMVTMVACAIFAGDIPTALLRIPGTPAAAAYADAAYGMTRRGLSQRVLSIALLFSVAGGLLGAVVLAVVGPQLARIATTFSVVEYFWLYLLGLSCAVLVSRRGTLPALVGLLVGLLLSTVGLSTAHGEARFTFGMPQLYQGIHFIPAMIGLFGLSEVLRNLASGRREPDAAAGAGSAASGRADGMVSGLGYALRLLGRGKARMLRAGGIGSLIGMLPGAGADIAAWVAMAVRGKGRKDAAATDAGDEASGTSDDEQGISSAASANSSALAGSWMPTLIFGIPGDSITAIAIGVLLMKNITPGPAIFEEQASLAYSIYSSFVMANIALLVVGVVAIQCGRWLVRTPRRVLLPAIVIFCLIGAFAVHGSYFDVLVMLLMGLLGFGLERFGVPLGPVVLGLILGGPLEERFVQSMTESQGSFIALFTRPGAAVLGTLCMIAWAFVAFRIVRSFRTASPSDASGQGASRRR